MFQPLYNLQNDNIFAFEALMRIQDCKWGPDKFIPIAERSGYILDLGQIAIEKSIEFLAKLSKQGHHDIKVTINLSALQLNDEGLMNYVVERATKYQINSNNIMFELTENIGFEESQELQSFTTACKEYGIELLLDDFGYGFSSIGVLGKIDFSIIKLHKAIVQDYLPSGRIRHLIDTIQSFEYAVLVEGVETKEQDQSVKQYGCDFVQRYYCARPMKS